MGLSNMKGFVVKPTLVFAYSAPFLIGLTLLFVHLPITYLLPQYIKSITPLKILSFNVFLSTIPVMQGVLLSSTEINRQMQLSIVWALAIGLNIILNYFFIRANWGISGVALATVISRGSVTATYFVMAHKYYLKGFISSTGYYLKLIFPLAFAWLIVTLIQRFSGYQSFSPLIIGFQLLAFSLAYLPLLMYMNKKTKFFAQVGALFLRKTV